MSSNNYLTSFADVWLGLFQVITYTFLVTLLDIKSSNAPNAPPVLVRVNWGEKKNCERASKPDSGVYQSSQLKPQSSLPDQVPA